MHSMPYLVVLRECDRNSLCVASLHACDALNKALEELARLHDHLCIHVCVCLCMYVCMYAY